MTLLKNIKIQKNLLFSASFKQFFFQPLIFLFQKRLFPVVNDLKINYFAVR